VPVYLAGLWVKDRLRGGAKRLGWPVVSVGSLSAGGAGKTPVVIALAVLLKEAGWGVDVLSRGYGRDASDDRLKEFASQVVPDVEDAASRFGDEPTLIAKATGVPVWVGANRHFSGTAAESFAEEDEWEIDEDSLTSASGPVYVDVKPEPAVRGLHLLDDGFQHRQLARAMDIVLVTAEDLQDVLLPAGNLREPLSALGRADVVVVREEEIVSDAREKQIPYGNDKQKGDAFKAKVWSGMREGSQMWVVRRRLVFPAPMFVFGAGLKPVAFCAIARPEGFATMLLDAGCGVVETVAFADHHRYTLGDVDRVVEVAQGLGASGFVTTEKDAVKLTAEMHARLEAVGPVMVVTLEVEFVDAAAVVRSIEARLQEARLDVEKLA
jgi:tetraacyldisaccharide 4'-kinase